MKDTLESNTSTWLTEHRFLISSPWSRGNRIVQALNRPPTLHKNIFSDDPLGYQNSTSKSYYFMVLDKFALLTACSPCFLGPTPVLTALPWMSDGSGYTNTHRVGYLTVSDGAICGLKCYREHNTVWAYWRVIGQVGSPFYWQIP